MYVCFFNSGPESFTRATSPAGEVAKPSRDRLDHCIEDMVTYIRRVIKGREDKKKERRKRRTEQE